MSNVIPFPAAATFRANAMPALSSVSLRKRSMDNLYAAERRAGTDPITAFERMCAFGDDLDRLADRIGGDGFRDKLDAVRTIMGEPQ